MLAEDPCFDIWWGSLCWQSLIPVLMIKDLCFDEQGSLFWWSSILVLMIKDPCFDEHGSLVSTKKWSRILASRILVSTIEDPGFKLSMVKDPYCFNDWGSWFQTYNDQRYLFQCLRVLVLTFKDLCFNDCGSMFWWSRILGFDNRGSFGYWRHLSWLLPYNRTRIPYWGFLISLPAQRRGMIFLISQVQSTVELHQQFKSEETANEIHIWISDVIYTRWVQKHRNLEHPFIRWQASLSSFDRFDTSNQQDPRERILWEDEAVLSWDNFVSSNPLHPPSPCLSSFRLFKNWVSWGYWQASSRLRLKTQQRLPIRGFLRILCCACSATAALKLNPFCTRHFHDQSQPHFNSLSPTLEPVLIVVTPLVVYFHLFSFQKDSRKNHIKIYCLFKITKCHDWCLPLQCLFERKCFSLEQQESPDVKYP